VQVEPLGSLQSMSWFAAQFAPQGMQAAGHWPSVAAAQGRGMVLQRKVQLATMPEGTRMVSRSLTHAWDWLVHMATGSQVSPISMAPLPHMAGQLLSLLRLQPEAGQQPSPLAHIVIVPSATHSAVHWPALPTSRRRLQPMAGQAVGQSAPSHFSLPSRTPLPQRALQSLSFTLVQPLAQQLSPFMQAVISPASTHSALHWAALPCRRRRWHP
jgi:hypothetical protein